MDQIKEFLHNIGSVLSYKIYNEISVGTLMLILFSIVAISFILKLVKKIVHKKLAEEDRYKFASVFGFLRYLLYILAIITILHTSGIDLTVFLTASAALFVGLGFALQYLFQDIISGVLIILDQSLHVGDIIEVENKVGKVTEINLRTTRAVTRDDKVIVIPNHKFLIESIYNHTQNTRSTIEKVSVGVAYGSDVQLVTTILEKIALSQPGVLKKTKPMVLFEDFGDSALLFSLVYTTADSFKDNKTKSEIRYKIEAEFRKHQIEIPFPQRTVHLVTNESLKTLK